MQSVKPLRLKRETYRPASESDSLKIAHVWVDSGVSHLDGVYSYLIPKQLVGQVVIGSRVKVSFNTRICEALVVDLEESETPQKNLKVIESLLGNIPLCNEKLITFFSKMANYWGSDPYSIINTAIPPRVASVESKIESALDSTKSPQFNVLKKRTQTFVMHKAHSTAYVELAEMALESLSQGSTILILPDVKDVDRISEVLSHYKLSIPIFRLDSSLPRRERYHNYLAISVSPHSLTIGTRSALFAPASNVRSIMIGFEKSEQYYEQRHPFWNVRESAFIRADIENSNLIFTGYVPSTDLGYRIENREVLFRGNKNNVKVTAFPQLQGELLPDRIITKIRKSLDEGTVLFLAPRKGYANALLCSQCKNIALCHCGARLKITKMNATPICTICSASNRDWGCKWCSHKNIYASARGVDRFHEEIGRAFPNRIIQISSAPNILEELSPKTNIVIATIGSVPGKISDCSAVVILEGQRFLSGTSVSYEELVVDAFFAAASRVRKNGNIFIVLDPYHPVVASITRWNPSLLVKKFLRENEDASLPPFTEAAVLHVDSHEAGALQSGLSRSISDERLPLHSRVFAIGGDENGKSRLLLTTPRRNRQILVDFLKELARKRAIAKKSPISFELNPFTLDS